jgi:hypothetical protein
VALSGLDDLAVALEAVDVSPMARMRAYLDLAHRMLITHDAYREALAVGFDRAFAAALAVLTLPVTIVMIRIRRAELSGADGSGRPPASVARGDS